jgi:hypothetical protein
MMDVPWKADQKPLRQFAFLWIMFFLGLALRFSWLSSPISPAGALSILAILIGVAGWFRPKIIRPIYGAWMIAVFPIGWTVSRLTLAILFYCVFTPLGLLFRLLGRDALNLSLQPEANSYWVLKEISNDPRRYLKQF